MSERYGYLDALARVRAVLDHHAGNPAFLPTSIELESEATAVARVAVAQNVAVGVLTADLERLAADALAHVPPAVEVGCALAWWAVRAYTDAGGPDPADAQ